MANASPVFALCGFVGGVLKRDRQTGGLAQEVLYLYPMGATGPMSDFYVHLITISIRLAKA